MASVPGLIKQGQTQLYQNDKWCDLLKLKIEKLQKEKLKEKAQCLKKKNSFFQFASLNKSSHPYGMKIIRSVKATILPYVQIPSKDVLINSNMSSTSDDTIGKSFSTRHLQKTQRNIWNCFSKTPLKKQPTNNYALTNSKSEAKLNFKYLHFSLYKNNKLLHKDVESHSKGVMTPRKLNDQDKYMNYIVRRVNQHQENADNSNS